MANGTHHEHFALRLTRRAVDRLKHAIAGAPQRGEAGCCAVARQQVRRLDARLPGAQFLVVRHGDKQRLLGAPDEGQGPMHGPYASRGRVPGDHNARGRGLQRLLLRHHQDGAATVEDRGAEQEALPRSPAGTGDHHTKVRDAQVIGEDISDTIGEAATRPDPAGDTAAQGGGTEESRGMLLGGDGLLRLDGRDQRRQLRAEGLGQGERRRDRCIQHRAFPGFDLAKDGCERHEAVSRHVEEIR